MSSTCSRKPRRKLVALAAKSSEPVSSRWRVYSFHQLFSHLGRHLFKALGRHVNETFTTWGIVVTASGKTIAILAANRALGALLTMVLAGDSRLRVRPFES